MATRRKRPASRAAARKSTTTRSSTRTAKAPQATLGRAKPAARRSAAAPIKKQAQRAASPREGRPRGTRAESATTLRILTPSSSLSTLRVVWRPAIAVATLPYRVYRVYRWAEAESHRSRAGGASATA